MFSRAKRSVIRRVPTEEIPQIIAASDVFFLGRQDGLNSGQLALAASYGKPVVFPEIGNFKEQMAHWPWKETYQPGDVRGAVNALDRMHHRIKKYPPGSVVFDNREWLDKNRWDTHVDRIIEAVNQFKKDAE
jgi:hypothetical protein